MAHDDELREIEELQAQLDQQLKENEIVALENEVFEAYLKRHVDPNEEAFALDTGDEGKGWRKKRNRKQKGASSLTIDQKLELVASEIDYAKKENTSMERKFNQMLETLKAVYEQTNIRMKELEKDAYEFKRDIVTGAHNPRTGKVMAERIIKYFEDRIRTKDALIEKLRLKNQSLRNNAKKIETQLRQKEEMGDVLHYIDFHQLQIENKQYLARIEEKNQQLLQLKMSTGQTVQTLNALKQRLSGLLNECSWRRQEIKTRTELLERLKTENVNVSHDISQCEKTVKRLDLNVTTGEGLPGTLDYVTIKQKSATLAKDVQSWQRKLEIAEMAVVRSRGLLRKTIKTALSVGLDTEPFEDTMLQTDELGKYISHGYDQNIWSEMSDVKGQKIETNPTNANRLSASNQGVNHTSSRIRGNVLRQSATSALIATPFGTKTQSGLYRGNTLSKSRTGPMKIK